MQKDTYNLSPNFKIQLDFALGGEENPLAVPTAPLPTHTGSTSFEFKALREIPEKLAWNSEELAFPTGRLGFKPCCTGAGDLRSHWTSVGLTSRKVTQELNNPASQPHRLSPRTRRKEACKGTLWTFLITAYVHKEERPRITHVEEYRRSVKSFPCQSSGIGPPRIYFSKLFATGNRHNSFSPTCYGPSNKNTTGFRFFF